MDWVQLEAESVVQAVQQPCEVLKKRARLQLTFVPGEYEDEDGDTATAFFLADHPPPPPPSSGLHAAGVGLGLEVGTHRSRRFSGAACEMGAAVSSDSQGLCCLNRSVRGACSSGGGGWNWQQHGKWELADSDSSRKQRGLSGEEGSNGAGFVGAEGREVVELSDEEVEDAQFTCGWCSRSVGMSAMAPMMTCSCLFCAACLCQHVEAAIMLVLAARRGNEEGKAAALCVEEGEPYIACPTPACYGRFDLFEAQCLAPEAFNKWEQQVSHEFLHLSPCFKACPGCGLVIETVASDVPQGVLSCGVPEIEKTAPYLERDKHGVPLSHAALAHKAANRFRCPVCTIDFCGKCMSNPYHEGKTCEEFEDENSAVRCIFCDKVIRCQRAERSRLLALQSKSTRELRSQLEREEVDMFWCVEKSELLQVVHNLTSAVCDAKECRKLLKASCSRTLDCGHRCGGVRGERHCLPCLEDACRAKAASLAGGKLLPAFDDLCPICLVEPIRRAPAIMLECGHIVHVFCGKKKLEEGYPGPAISFGFLKCSQCPEIMRHIVLEHALEKQVCLKELVREKATKRLRMEAARNNDKKKGLFRSFMDHGSRRGTPITDKPDEDALNKYQYYMCCKCKHPYFGGMQECGVGNHVENGDGHGFNPLELICGGCSAAESGQAVCKKGHGQEYIEFKCRYCCSMATYFCFGQTHFCESCHQQRPDLHKERAATTKCRGFPSCPLGIPHPPNGKEFCLGCSMCRLQGQ